MRTAIGMTGCIFELLQKFLMWTFSPTEQPCENRRLQQTCHAQLGGQDADLTGRQGCPAPQVN